MQDLLETKAAENDACLYLASPVGYELSSITKAQVEYLASNTCNRCMSKGWYLIDLPKLGHIEQVCACAQRNLE